MKKLKNSNTSLRVQQKNFLNSEIQGISEFSFLTKIGEEK